MKDDYKIKIPPLKTLVERLQEEGFKIVAEFKAGEAFPTEIVPREGKESLPGVEVRIVDKAELYVNYIPRKVYVVCARTYKPGKVYELLADKN